ncbi:MAG: hypothetical protein L0H93_23370, partial [Nocardioides sp.]|nr:hypothetical protein [Nocardioides sp.]
MTREMHPSRWGDPASAAPLPASTRELVELALGIRETTTVTEVRLPAIGLPPELLDELRSILGSDHVLTDDEHRRLRTRGKSTTDLLRARAAILDVGWKRST